MSDVEASPVVHSSSKTSGRHRDADDRVVNNGRTTENGDAEKSGYVVCYNGAYYSVPKSAFLIQGKPLPLFEKEDVHKLGAGSKSTGLLSQLKVSHRHIYALQVELPPSADDDATHQLSWYIAPFWAEADIDKGEKYADMYVLRVLTTSAWRFMYKKINDDLGIWSNQTRAQKYGILKQEPSMKAQIKPLENKWERLPKGEGLPITVFDEVDSHKKRAAKKRVRDDTDEDAPNDPPRTNTVTISEAYLEELVAYKLAATQGQQPVDEE